MIALLVIDMQVGLFGEDSLRHDAEGDSTVRAAASRDYEIIVVEDGHTTADRPHMDAVSVIRHHNWVWENLILPGRQVTVLPAASIAARVEARVSSSR